MSEARISTFHGGGIRAWAGHFKARLRSVSKYAQGPDPAAVEVGILASDINYSVLRAAQDALSETQMESVDYAFRLRYFDKVGDRYAIKRPLKDLVHFDFHNLKTEFFASAQ